MAAPPPSPHLTYALCVLDAATWRVLALSLHRGLSDEAIAAEIGAHPRSVRAARLAGLERLESELLLEPWEIRRLARSVGEGLERESADYYPALPSAASAPMPRPNGLVSRQLPAPESVAKPAVLAVATPARTGREPGPERRVLGLPDHVWVLAGVLLVAAVLRLWRIDAIGLNSDEAVYLGQGAAIADVPALAPYFPTFRAHPLLFQTITSLGFHIGIPELFGRAASAAFGVATVWMTYLLGTLLYHRRAGAIAALLLALMPYHIVVTRQILLDGPMVFFATSTLYLLARYTIDQRPVWLYATAGALGLTFLGKESSIILIASVYAFLALTPQIRTRPRHLAGAGALFVAIVAASPIAVMLAGKTKTGGDFIAWQLFRRPNHEWTFYPSVVPVAIGVLVVLCAILGLWRLRTSVTWRETLLVTWIAVPIVFFQMFPVKGFQYLLPIAPVVAVLAARFLADYRPAERGWLTPSLARRVPAAALFVVVLSLLVPAVRTVQPPNGATFLAGSGGLPGGREAGRWIADHVPKGARMMSVGPSMANVLQYYGRRKTYGLSVSPNPLRRNPVYEPMLNPDRLIRDNEVQYVVWDAFSAERSPFFSRKLLRYVERYNGFVVHSETVPATTPSGRTTRKPVIRIYEVRP